MANIFFLILLMKTLFTCLKKWGLTEQSKQTPILAYGVEPYSLKRKLAFYV